VSFLAIVKHETNITKSANLATQKDDIILS